MKTARRPINKQVIVIYPDGAYSLIFKRYVDTLDVRDACTNGDECMNTEEHWTFDGQFFYKKEVS